jgi:glucose/arabinose dehydrogenase
MKTPIPLIALLNLVALAATTLPAQEENYSPGTYQLTPEIDLHLQPVRVEIPGKFGALRDDLTLNLPPGFTVSVFAAGNLNRPRFMAFDSAGVLHVADMRTDQDNGSRIIAFPDRDGDGIADGQIVAAGNFKWAHSLAFYKGDMYVAETHQIVRLRDNDKDGIYEEREIFIEDIPSVLFHFTRTIVIDEENEKIYLSVGFPCDLCRQDEPVRGSSSEDLPLSDEWGTVLQFNIDGSGRRVYARGIRNAVGLDLHPVTGALWGTHNHWDRGGDHLPPEWIDIIRDGDFMGYPFVYGYQTWVNFNLGNYRKIRPITRADTLLAQTQKRPVSLVAAHLAPLAIHFYTHDHFPTRYRNVAFVALHGGQVEGNLAVVPGFKIIALFSEPDGSNARIADFLTGFVGGPKRTDVWGKPAGIISDSQGHLYISSDVTNRAILRISAQPLIATWALALPDTVAGGAVFDLDATVQLQNFDAAGETPQLSADLSALGGPASLALSAETDSTYRLRTSFKVDIPNGAKSVRLLIEQETAEQTHTLELLKTIVVLPGADLTILGDALSAGWQVEFADGAAPLDFVATGPVYAGEKASAFQVEPTSFFKDWKVDFVPSAPQATGGYTALHFAFFPGALERPNRPTFAMRVNDKITDLVRGLSGIRADLSLQDWQVVEIPLEDLELEGPIETIQLTGNFTGNFFVDDMRLLTAATGLPSTAVLEQHSAALPRSFSLEQNHPNPFNSTTVIRFFLPSDQHVDLAVYNLAGQRMTTLVRGLRPAGTYAVHWDGRDHNGRAPASGIYLYQLRGQHHKETRKMLLLR